MEGRVVPKHLYKADPDGVPNEHDHSLYHSIGLGRGQVHNVIINCRDPGAVLTWDFDVMRHKVMFTVLHKELIADSNTLGNFAIFYYILKSERHT